MDFKVPGDRSIETSTLETNSKSGLSRITQASGQRLTAKVSQPKDKKTATSAEAIGLPIYSGSTKAAGIGLTAQASQTHKQSTLQAMLMGHSSANLNQSQALNSSSQPQPGQALKKKPGRR